MGKQTEHALRADAAKRLREALGREPTQTEIRQLRCAEQALGLEHPAFAKARELVARSRALRNLKNHLLAELRKKRKKARSLRRKWQS